MSNHSKGIIVGLFILFFVFFVLAVFNSGSSDTQDTSDRTARMGDTIVIRSNDCDGVTVLATTPENYNLFVKAQVADNRRAYSEMVGYGLLFIVPNCEKATVIDTATGLRKIRIANMEGWTAVENVTN